MSEYWPQFIEGFRNSTKAFSYGDIHIMRLREYLYGVSRKAVESNLNQLVIDQSQQHGTIFE